MKYLTVLPSELYRIAWSPYCAFTGAEDYGHEIALLLNLFHEFHNNIDNARKKLGISISQTLPEGEIKIEHISKLGMRLDRKKTHMLLEECELICNKYKLTDNWIDSFEVLILTNVLLIPYKDIGIRIHLPDNLYTNEGRKKLKDSRVVSMSVGGIDSLLKSEAVLNYPAIYLTRFVEPTNIAKWLNEKGKYLEKLFVNLPKTKKLKVRSETLVIGHLVYVLSEVFGLSYSDIDKLVKDKFEEGDRLSILLDGKNYTDLADNKRKFIQHMESLAH